jgi:hypothetical protein
MNGHFISRTGTRHILGPAVSQLQGGRLTALCGFSQSRDEEPPGEAIQICGWCLEAEDRARRTAQDALARAAETAAPAKNLLSRIRRRPYERSRAALEN